MKAIRNEGREVRRGHACDPPKGHGFIDSQKRGMEVFREIPGGRAAGVVEAVWQYTHHILHGPLHAPRADSDGGELERRMARGWWGC